MIWTNQYKSASNTIVKLKSKDGTDLSFYKLHPDNTMKVIENVITPAFLSDENYKYLYPNVTDRELAINHRFKQLIPSLMKSKHINSFMLKNDEMNEEIGHVLLYGPNDNESESEYHESILDYLCVSNNRHLIKVSNKLTTGIKMLCLMNVMNHEYNNINRVINKFNDNYGYWEISCVSINPNIQSIGYGTLIMNNIHNIIKRKNETRCDYYNTPTILFTSTPAALRFYEKLGYKRFMETSVFEANNNQITSYSLIYHHDNKVLKQWMNILNDNVPYYKKINRYSFLPRFIRKKINKPQYEHINCDDYSLNYYFEY